MPRRFDGPLLALGDGVERQLRAAAARESQEEVQEEAAPTDDEESPLDVHALAQNIAQRANGAPVDPFAFNASQGNEVHVDPIAFNASQGNEVQVLEAVEVDGQMARDEDAAELVAAEQVVADQEAAGDEAAAAALEAADTEPESEEPVHQRDLRRPVGSSIPGHRGKGGKKVPKRHRKVLRYVAPFSHTSVPD